MIKFFTYGTFRKGECRNYILENFAHEFLGEIHTQPKYTLLDLGSFPGMIKEGNKAIVGELYNIADEALAVFDMIESHPTFFCRNNIELGDGTEAIGYLFPTTTKYREIESGDWKKK